ncbi:hypothetical protein FB645_001728 [Coemansia sp. IMI 203386]|nr:hypothetical protein FB645_001728 [Coemansia sp. IMI 203386]
MAVQMKGMRAVYVDSTGSFSYSGSRRAAQKLRDQIQNESGLDILPETRTLLEGISWFAGYKYDKLAVSGIVS